MKLHIFFTLIMFLLFAGIYSLQAQIPSTLSYQGILTDSSGNLKSDSAYSVVFRLYDAEAEGMNLWSEAKLVSTKRGLFSTILGDQTIFPQSLKFDKPYWLSIQFIGQPELSPRIPLTSVGYSLNSVKSDTALVSMFSISDTLWTKSGSDIYRLNGNVGIGTTSPAQKLSVIGYGESDPNNPVGSYQNNIDGAAILLNLENSQPAAVGSTNETVELRFGVAGGGWGNVAARIIAGKERDYMSMVNSDGYLAFHTTTDAGTQPYEKMRITSAGNVGIGTVNPQGALDVSSTTGAFIVPRMTTTQRDALAAINGMVIYNTTTNQFNFRENGAWVTK